MKHAHSRASEAPVSPEKRPEVPWDVWDAAGLRRAHRAHSCNPEKSGVSGTENHGGSAC